MKCLNGVVHRIQFLQPSFCFLAGWFKQREGLFIHGENQDELLFPSVHSRHDQHRLRRRLPQRGVRAAAGRPVVGGVREVFDGHFQDARAVRVRRVLLVCAPRRLGWVDA